MILEVVGAGGAVVLLIAYYCVTTGRWSRASLWYQGANLAGAVLLVGYGIGKHAYANIVLNLFWAGVAVIGVATWRRHTQRLSTRK